MARRLRRVDFPPPGEARIARWECSVRASPTGWQLASRVGRRFNPGITRTWTVAAVGDEEVERGTILSLQNV